MRGASPRPLGGTWPVRYLLDTNHWGYLQERHVSVSARVRQLPDRAWLGMSVVTQAELLAGVELVPSVRRRRELSLLYKEAVATATEIVPVTSPVAVEFARISFSLWRKGRPIETNDIWLAAAARALNLTLVSNDPDFQHVDGLGLEDWT